MALETTADDLLGGALTLLQPVNGYRIGMDTVLLAAAVGANPGDQVLEPGIGTGGAALCLAHRLADITVHGVDKNPDHLMLAKENFTRNGIAHRLTVEEADISTLTGDGSGFAHCMMNPPFVKEGAGRAAKGKGKSAAHMAMGTDIKDWVRYAVHHTKAKGSITLIHRADRLDEIIRAIGTACGDISLFPLWPKAGVPANRVIIKAIKGSKGVTRLLPGLILHGAHDRYTPEATAILRDGAPIIL